VTVLFSAVFVANIALKAKLDHSYNCVGAMAHASGCYAVDLIGDSHYDRFEMIRGRVVRAPGTMD
jgi:hypothetical protein